MSDMNRQFMGAELAIQIDNCPQFNNYGSKSKISIVHPYVESSSFGGFVKKRIPTGVTRYEIEFRVVDSMLDASQLWFAPFNSTGITTGLQKPTIFKFYIPGMELEPLTLVGLLQLKEYQTNITGMIEFSFIFTGTLPIGMPEVPTSVYAADLEPTDSITDSESYSWSPSSPIPESESESLEIPLATIEVPFESSSSYAGPIIMPNQVPFAPSPSLIPSEGAPIISPNQDSKPEEPIEPKPKRKVSFQ